MNTTEPHRVDPEYAVKILDWLKTRGGLALWGSIDLSDLGASWTGPLNNADGTPSTKPHWKSASTPYRIITDPAEVVVATMKEVKRFRVGIRLGSQGMTYKVTDGGTRRIRREVVKAGVGATHVFDYETQEAVILAPESEVPIVEYVFMKVSQ